MISESPTNGTASAVDALYGPPTPPDLEALTRAERHSFRAAVAQVVSTAKEKLPAELHGRLEKAQTLVLAGDVQLQPEGKALVGSQSDGRAQYALAPGLCPCKGFSTAPQGLCSHRLAAAVLRRATSLLSGDVTPDADVEPGEASPAVVVHTPAPLSLPEAPASVNCHVTIGGRQVQVTLRDSDETRLLARLTALLAQYPVAAAAQTPTATPNAQAPTPEGWCLMHQTQMTRQSNDRGSWWSHAKPDGGWCRGKAPRS